MQIYLSSTVTLEAWFPTINTTALGQSCILIIKVRSGGAPISSAKQRPNAIMRIVSFGLCRCSSPMVSASDVIRVASSRAVHGAVGGGPDVHCRRDFVHTDQ